MGIIKKIKKKTNKQTNMDNSLTPIRIEANDGYHMGGHDDGLITRNDPSSYHSAFGANSFKTEADGQYDDDMYALVNSNTNMYLGIALIFTLLVVMWIKNIANIQEKLSGLTKEEKS